MRISRSTHLLPLGLAILSSLWFNPTFTQTPGPAQVPDRESSPAEISACGFNRALEQKLEVESFRLKQEAIERGLYEKAQELLRNPNAGRSAAAEETLTIPLVVHIVHLNSEPNPGDGPSNPTDEQILAGIEHLNEAYRNTGSFAGSGRQNNAALQSVDVGIEFCLAQRDINGNPTTGILRYANDGYAKLNMDTDDPNMQQWVATQNGNSYPGTDYANVWLVNEICASGGNSCSVAGYAYFPGNHGSVSNGVINRARYWGSSANNSKVHIHEFGHYLNLYHTFQGGCTNNDCLAEGDRVCDTPPDASTAYNSCGSDANSCTTDADSPNSPFQTDVGDLYENYMDYSSNSCQNTFTQGQKERMRAALLGARGSLLNSQACIPVDGAEAGLTRIVSPDQSLCSTSFIPVVEVESNGNQAINTLEFGVMLDGVPRPNVSWSGNILPGQTAQITLDPLSFNGVGSHQLTVELLSSNGGPDPFTNNNVQIRNFRYADPLTALPFCEDLESGELNPDWVISNQDNVVGFETYSLDACSETGNYALGLQTWGVFPSQTTVEDLFTQSIDLSNASEVSLAFDVAYAIYYSNFNTVLEISVSTDCGINYTTLYEKTGSALATARREALSANDANAFFVPADCSEWKSESIPLDQYTGQQILIRFRAKTEDVVNSNYGYYWGNNLYLDNICLLGNSDGDDPVSTDCNTEELELINSAIPSGNYDNVGMIIAGERLVDGAEVVFTASESIVLLPGFKVEEGTSFQAGIAPCQNSAAPEEEPAALSELLQEQQDRPWEPSGILGLEVAPNPMSDQAKIKYLVPAEAGRAHLVLTDLYGRKIKNFQLAEGEGQWQSVELNRNALQLPSGIYLLSLEMEGRVVIKKIVVSRK